MTSKVTSAHTAPKGTHRATLISPSADRNNQRASAPNHFNINKRHLTKILITATLLAQKLPLSDRLRLPVGYRLFRRNGSRLLDFYF